MFCPKFFLKWQNPCGIITTSIDVSKMSARIEGQTRRRWAGKRQAGTARNQTVPEEKNRDIGKKNHAQREASFRHLASLGWRVAKAAAAMDSREMWAKVFRFSTECRLRTQSRSWAVALNLELYRSHSVLSAKTDLNFSVSLWIESL